VKHLSVDVRIWQQKLTFVQIAIWKLPVGSNAGTFAAGGLCRFTPLPCGFYGDATRAYIPDGRLRERSALDEAGERTLETAMRRMSLSARVTIESSKWHARLRISPGPRRYRLNLSWKRCSTGVTEATGSKAAGFQLSDSSFQLSSSASDTL
jgi:hypothetical protein